MTAFGWVLVGWLALEAVASVAAVGRPRRPMTTETAVVLVLIQVAWIVGILAWGT